EIFDALNGNSPRSSYEIVRGHWAAQNPVPDFELKWRRALSDGVVNGLTVPAIGLAAGKESRERLTPNAQHPMRNLEVVFRSDVSVRDGRYANNGWLQEL